MHKLFILELCTAKSPLLIFAWLLCKLIFSGKVGLVQLPCCHQPVSSRCYYAPRPCMLIHSGPMGLFVSFCMPYVCTNTNWAHMTAGRLRVRMWLDSSQNMWTLIPVFLEFSLILILLKTRRLTGQPQSCPAVPSAIKVWGDRLCLINMKAESMISNV